MKVPLSWLKEYLTLNETAEEIADRMTMLGLEVEEIETFVPSFQNVVVGRVVSCEKHPDAEKLQIAQVTDGAEVYQVVCGAPNCREGLKTAFCKVGSCLEEESGKAFKIRKAKIRGVESFGMLASAVELRVGEESDGILELPENVAEGQALHELYEGTVFDVSLTPNLGFAASMIGVARELSASYSEKVSYPKFTLEESKHSAKDFVTVDVQNPELCPHYAARVITDVNVVPSPIWMQERLTSAGVRPVNNIVDVTNYVLLEMGHPLHAFDQEKLNDSTIVVRTSKEGEKLITLDEKERTLPEGLLLICDAKRPIAIAGVMGGLETEITDSSKTVILESAYFDSTVVRKGSKKYALLTDAARRFQTGADPENVRRALDRAAALIAELSGGKVASGVVEVVSRISAPKQVEIRVSRANQLLGTSLSPGEIESLFERLSYDSTWKDADTLVITVPTYRCDISIEEDLVEEVARIHGFANIPRTEARFQASSAPHSPIYELERKVRGRLIAEGLQEMITCDLISPKQSAMMVNEALPEEALVKVLNPTSVEQSVLRSSLLPGLLASLKYNSDRQQSSISAFEVGKTHFKSQGNFKEQSAMAIILTGKTRPHHWEEKPREVDFYDLKGMCESVLKSLHIPDVQCTSSEQTIFHPGRQAVLKVGTMTLGSIGELHPALMAKLGIEGRVFYAEINLHDMMQATSKRLRMDDIPQFPGSERDLTLTMREDAPVQEFFAAVNSESSPLLKGVTLRDVYRSERLGSEKKNVTFRFVYRDDTKTVSQQEVDAEHERITQKILKQLGKAVV